VSILASCSSDSSSSTKSSGAGTSAGTATITKFDVPESVSCPAGGPPNTTFSASWSTEGAAHVALILDGHTEPETDKPSGTASVQVHCDAIPHTVVLAAYDAKDDHTVQRKILKTILPS
jgi:hypothetical protein